VSQLPLYIPLQLQINEYHFYRYLKLFKPIHIHSLQLDVAREIVTDSPSPTILPQVHKTTLNKAM